MTTATERIPVLVTKFQKQQLTSKAKAAGLSTGEFLRRAGEMLFSFGRPRFT